MRIYHTSPEEIKKIHEKGRFGPGLFFSEEPYYMTEAENPHLYGLDINEDELIDPSSFSYLETEDYNKIKHVVKDIGNYLGVNEETALEFLSQSKDPHNFMSELEDEISSHEDEDDLGEEYKKKKHIHKHWSKKDLGELSWDMQREALRAANFLGKKGVHTPDETGTSYLINLMNNESLLKRLGSDEDYERFSNYED